MNAKNNLVINTISSLMYQAALIISGLIIPKLIISSYGSEVNGLINSISQFLGFFSFLELGIVAVVQSSLYKPLSLKDKTQIGKVVHSATRFFNTLGALLVLYVIVLLIIYPRITVSEFSFTFIDCLIIIMSLNSFAQYLFGLVDSILLTADQVGYIVIISQSITVVANVIISIILVNMHASVHLLKTATAVIYVLRPIIIRIYVNRRYKINRKEPFDKEPINQKWNGVAQHICFIVLRSTDVVVLTVLSTLSNVSIYSVYYLVVEGLASILSSFTSGVEPMMGRLWAEGNTNKLKQVFDATETFFHLISTIVYTCCYILIVPFISIYTNGVTDANYKQPVFALLISIAYLFRCLRLPYNIQVFISGKYKETQRSYFIAAIINIIISVMMVKKFGLIGVAIGTIAAMGYQAIWIAVYDSKNIIKTSLKHLFKHLLIDFLIFLLGGAICRNMVLNYSTYFNWFLSAILIAVIVTGMSIIVYWIFFKDHIVFYLEKIKRRNNKPR